jgi:hypothetical protein
MTHLSFSSKSDPAELIEELLPRNSIPYYVVGVFGMRFKQGAICVYAKRSSAMR